MAFDRRESTSHTAACGSCVAPKRVNFVGCVLHAALAIALLALPARADVVDSIDRGELGGIVALASGDSAITLTDAQGNAQPFNLVDLDRVRFNIELSEKPSDQLLLIDNDAPRNTGQKQASAKLRSGLHRITVPYWQASGTHTLTLYASGPGIDGRAELGADHLRCFRDTGDSAPPSPGFDKEGYRLAELPLADSTDRRRMLTRARYRLYVSQNDTIPQSIDAIGGMQLKRSGTASSFNTGMLNQHNANVGLIFEAFFVAPQDGTYQFTLLSDDGAQLHFGEITSFQTHASAGQQTDAPWRVSLAHDGSARAQLKAIDNQRATLHLPQIGDAAVDLSHIRAVWHRSVDQGAIDRENEPSDLDTVYLRDKNDATNIRSVSGKIASMDDAALRFVFRGAERSITRDRVAGLVLRHTDRPAPPPPGLHQVFELAGGQVLPGRIESIDERLRFALLGGGVLEPPRELAGIMRIENGRRIDLTRVQPSAEEAIPYFGFQLPYRLNTDFSGEPIVLYDDAVYDRGLAVHSKSRLHYKLKPNSERFQARFGLLKPGGKLGNVTARVLGDGVVLWEQTDITAETGVVPVDVALNGVQRIILEVDFGEGQNVGDRAAWCRPRLIYAREARQ